MRQGSYVDEWASLLDERVPDEDGDDTDPSRTRFDRSDCGDGFGDERRGR